MKLIGFVGLLITSSFIGCTYKEERKIAAGEVTETANTRESNTVKTSSARELESQFKGCKAHW